MDKPDFLLGKIGLSIKADEWLAPGDSSWKSSKNTHVLIPCASRSASILCVGVFVDISV